MTAEPRAQIRDFIQRRYPTIDITNSDDIFALGFVNSLFAMELVMFVEKSFGHTIPNDELNLDNFRTIDAMAALADRLADRAPVDAVVT